MKTSIYNFCLLLLLTSCQSCELINPEPKTELEKLPPPTQEGKHIFGCLINGKAWYETITSGHYQQGSLYVGARQRVFEPVLQSMGLNLREDSLTLLLSVGTYDLRPSSPYFPSVGYNYSSCYWEREDTITGKLTITKFDKVNFIVSGLFEFTTTNIRCDTIKVTDGRFDIKYVP